MSEALLKMKSELVQNKFEDTDDLDAVLNFVPQEYIFLTSFLGEQVNKPIPVEEHEEKKPLSAYPENVVFADLGAPAFALKARVQLLRDLGSAAAPFNAFLIAQGLETLSLRMERHVANARKVAEFLDGRDDVTAVNYAGLPGSPWHERATKLAPRGTGAVLSFELAGGIGAGKAFVDGLRLHSHVANIGDVRSLVIHPASTTHQQLSAAEQRASGVTPGLVRLAVGLEGIDDIIADLECGFTAAAGR